MRTGICSNQPSSNNCDSHSNRAWGHTALHCEWQCESHALRKCHQTQHTTRLWCGPGWPQSSPFNHCSMLFAARSACRPQLPPTQLLQRVESSASTCVLQRGCALVTVQHTSSASSKAKTQSSNETAAEAAQTLCCRTLTLVSCTHVHT